MKLNFLFSGVLAGTMYLFQWLDDFECAKSPTIIYGYTLKRPYDAGKAEHPDETWPFFQMYWAPFYPRTVCGRKAANGALKDLCCTSSVNLTKTNGATSVTTNYYPDEDVIDTKYFPETVNEQFYCKLQKDDKHSLYGYKELYLKNNERCMESMRCMSNGQLLVFESNDCYGASRPYQLDSSPSSYFNDSLLGNFTGIFDSIKNGARVVGWTEYAPYETMLIKLDNSKGIFMIISVISTSLAQTTVFGYVTYKFLQKRSTRGLFLCVSEFLWLAHFLVYIIPNFFNLKNSGVYFSFIRVQDLLKSIVYLINSFFTGFCVICLLELSRKQAIVVYSVIFLVHLLLMGNNWLSFTLFLGDTHVSDWDTFLIHWNNLNVIYLPIALIWDLSQFLVLFWWVGKIKMYGFKEWVVKVVKLDRFIPVLGCCQVLIVLGYFIISILTADAVMILANDRNYLYVVIFQQCLLVVHATLNLLLIERFVKNAAFREQKGKDVPGNDDSLAFGDESNATEANKTNRL